MPGSDGVSAPAAVAAAAFFGLAARSEALSSARVLREAPWKIVVFSLGMCLVVLGLRTAGLTASFRQGIIVPVPVLGITPLALAGWVALVH